MRFFLALLLSLVSTLIILPDVSWAAMDYSKQSLIEADFSNQDLHGVTFNLTNLLKSNLSGADLEGASLFRAKLQEANLSNANLKGVTLDSAVLVGTDLTNAVLEDSFAFDTRFENVRIQGADFTNVLMDEDSIISLCSIANGTNPTTNRKTKDTLDCP